VTPLNAPSHADLPKAILVTTGFDMLRDAGHAYAQKLAKDGNDITYVHYPELPHGIIQMNAHSKRCMEAALQLARLLGEGLKKPATRSARA
jgi:acetyl esterase